MAEATPSPAEFEWRRFARILIASLVLTLVASVAAVNLVIDPYGEYQLWSDYSYRSSSTTAYRVARKLREKPYTLVFGTSTAAPIDEVAIGGDVLNFSMSVYGLPERIRYFLESLDPQQIANIETIYIAVEYNAFKELAPERVDHAYRSASAFYLETLRNIQRTKIHACLDWLMKKVSGRADSVLTEFGVYKHLKSRPYKEIRYREPLFFTHSPGQVEHLARVVDFSSRNGIELIVFRTVTTRYLLENTDFQSLEKHFGRILEAVPSFYSLMWLDGVSEDLSKFRDAIHPSYDAMRREMAILRSPERVRYRVTRETLAGYLGDLRAKLERK